MTQYLIEFTDKNGIPCTTTRWGDSEAEAIAKLPAGSTVESVQVLAQL